MSQDGRNKNLEWRLNTSNLGKLKEFQALFSKYGINLKATQIDLPEIDADPMTVIAQKASQLEDYVLVEDTSLEIEGATVGVNVRWLLEHLSEFAEKKAVWSVLLAYKLGNEVYLYRGQIKGKIVFPRGSEGFGFDPVFLPDGSNQTLAQYKPDIVNARAKAVEALVKNEKFQIVKALFDWQGPWQRH